MWRLAVKPVLCAWHASSEFRVFVAFDGVVTTTIGGSARDFLTPSSRSRSGHVESLVQCLQAHMAPPCPSAVAQDYCFFGDGNLQLDPYKLCSDRVLPVCGAMAMTSDSCFNHVLSTKNSKRTGLFELRPRSHLLGPCLQLIRRVAFKISI